MIETTFEGCEGVMFSPSDLLIASSELQLVVILTLFISSAQFSCRNLSVSGLVIFADFLRQRDKFAFCTQSKCMYATFHEHLGISDRLSCKYYEQYQGG